MCSGSIDAESSRCVISFHFEAGSALYIEYKWLDLEVYSNFVQIGPLVESNNSLRRILSGAEILEHGGLEESRNVPKSREIC